MLCIDGFFTDIYSISLGIEAVEEAELRMPKCISAQASAESEMICKSAVEAKVESLE